MLRIFWVRARRTLKEIGREVIKAAKAESLGVLEGFEIGEAVQYYAQGWRYGHIAEVPVKGLRRGMARVEHPITGKVWVKGSYLKKL